MFKDKTYKRCTCRGPVYYKRGPRKGQQIFNDDGTPRIGLLEGACPELSKRAHGSWYYYIELPAGIGGHRQRDRRGGFATQKAAEKAAEASWKAAQSGINVLTNETVEEYLRRWHKKKAADLARTTHHEYGRDIDLYFVPHLGHLKIRDLRAKHIQNMYDWILEENLRRREQREKADQLKLAMEAAQTAWRQAPARTREEKAARSAKRGVWNDAKAAYADARAKVQKETGPATMESINATLKSALSDAVIEELIAKNYAKFVTLPKVNKPDALVWTPERIAYWERTGKKPSPVMVWDVEQTVQFLDFVAEDRHFTAWHIIIFHGLRRGEIAGVTWDDIDLKNGVIHVARQRVSVNYEIHEDDPKADSKGSVLINSDSVVLLTAWREQQQREREEWEAKAGAGTWENHDNRVFTQEDGSEYHPQHFTDRWDLLVEKSGLPPIRLHDGRHEAGTLALAGGAKTKAVQKMLRHKTKRMTEDTYQAVLPELLRETVDASQNLVAQARKKKAKAEKKKVKKKTRKQPPQPAAA
ncbi:site-specific integrase [Streptomyces sp. MBT49]|uniref:tyrosine-type recombinase/integrase n=1 Tax=Streptomyces sp. MBT49 TaxID=1488380 RepID=UPI00190E1658|nr:site-specific integrase [Streptomyces sp. MBT49]MBK3624778.1 site-specific integrase [Streptomyces sp. MBT49]